MEINELTADLVRWNLQLEQVRATTAANNIANAHTEGFHAMRVDFQQQLQSLDAARGDTHALAQSMRDIETAGFRITEQQPLSALGATVNLDAEVAEMVAAGTRYQSLMEAFDRHLGLMRLAVRGRS